MTLGRANTIALLALTLTGVALIVYALMAASHPQERPVSEHWVSTHIPAHDRAQFASLAYQGKDYGFLRPDAAGNTDSEFGICDHESDGVKAHENATNLNPVYLGQVWDEDGAGGSCWILDAPNNYNLEKHETCEGNNCGDWSPHPGLILLPKMLSGVISF